MEIIPITNNRIPANYRIVGSTISLRGISRADLRELFDAAAVSAVCNDIDVAATHCHVNTEREFSMVVAAVSYSGIDSFVTDASGRLWHVHGYDYTDI